MKKSWMTSSDVIFSLTARPTGTCSSLISRWPLEVLDLPHPLLADDVELLGVGRRPRGGEVDLRAPDEDDQRDDQRDHDPRDLEQQRIALDVAAHLAWRRRR